MFTKLLVPLDRSFLAQQAVDWASAIARAAHAGVEVMLVHERETMSGVGDAPWNAARVPGEEQWLESIARALSASASVPATHVVLSGNPVDMICARAVDIGADLVVMTSHGRTGLSRAWLGSVTDGVLRHASIPVLLLRPVEGQVAPSTIASPFTHILVPLDGSGLSMEILPSACALARCGGARITLLRVVEPVPLVAVGVDMAMPFTSPKVQDEAATEAMVSSVKRDLSELAQRMSAEEGLAVTPQVVVARVVAKAIVDSASANDADLIAMSTHGRGVSRLLLGSVADKVLRGGELPMLLYRPLGVTKGTLATRSTGAESAASFAHA